MPAEQRERRRASRRVPDAREALAHVRLRAGKELDVIDVSNSGVLVEGAARLLPGTQVDVHVITNGGRELVRSRVARAFVSRIDAAIVYYRGALAFERIVDASPPGYAIPNVLADVAATTGTPYPTAAHGAADLDDGTGAV